MFEFPSKIMEMTKFPLSFKLYGREYPGTREGYIQALDDVYYRVAAHWPGRFEVVALLEKTYDFLKTLDDDSAKEIIAKIDELRIIEKPAMKEKK